MPLILIALKIYNRTRQTHQANTEHYIFTPNISNHHKIMIDRSKPISPDADAIILLLDETITESLNSHDTYKVKSLFHQLWKLNHTSSYDNHREIKILEEVIEKVYAHGIQNSEIAQQIDKFVRENKNKTSNTTDPSTIEPFFAEGANCNLLQPDGKGWQKGKIKICFEFIPEENESVETQSDSVETHCSPLDKIRQLSNELASVGSIEQN